MVKLSYRLKKIASLVDCRRIADVGCDHGKIVLELFEKGKIDFAIVSDISQPSLQKAIDKLNENGYRNFKSIVCDGLSKFKNDDNIEQIIISGMGGLEIVQILENSPIELKNLILQPQRDIVKVKQYLIENNFEINYDIILKDGGKFYNVIKASKISNDFSKLDFKNSLSEAQKVDLPKDFYLEFGKENFDEKTSDFVEYLKYLENKNLILLEKMTDKEKKSQVEKILEYIKIAKQLLGEKL